MSSSKAQSPMPAMQAVVSVLESEGVEVMFGIPGAAVLPLYKAALEHSSIKHVIVRHEEGGTHAADAYSRATGKIGVAVGTSGPAGTNMVTGLYTAWAASTIAVRPSPSSPNSACTGRSRGSATVAVRRSPPKASSSTSMVPSPPSASGISTAS